MDTTSLQGKTAIVTGAGGGIGRAIAALFARDGASVVVADRNGDGAAETVRSIAADGGRAIAVETDICSEASLEKMVGSTLAWTGRIDVLAANAGIMADGDVLTVTPQVWRQALEVNVTGSFLTVRAVLPSMIERRTGSIVFTASTVGLAGFKGAAAYSASKGAVVAMTRQLAADYAGSNIRVNALAPGAVRTALSESQMHARARTPEELAELERVMIARYPLSRWGTPEEIAQAALYLASDRSSWTTGIILAVDGGLTATR